MRWIGFATLFMMAGWVTGCQQPQHCCARQERSQSREQGGKHAEQVSGNRREINFDCRARLFSPRRDMLYKVTYSTYDDEERWYYALVGRGSSGAFLPNGTIHLLNGWVFATDAPLTTDPPGPATVSDPLLWVCTEYVIAGSSGSAVIVRRTPDTNAAAGQWKHQVFYISGVRAFAQASNGVTPTANAPLILENTNNFAEVTVNESAATPSPSAPTSQPFANERVFLNNVKTAANHNNMQWPAGFP